MKKITVIGAGPGCAAGMTVEAARAVEGADVVFAAARHAHLAGGKCVPLEPLSAALDAIQARLHAGAKSAVLLSGDAALFSLLPALARRFGAENLDVIPGVGALQSLCAALRESWQGAEILSAHGRDLPVSALLHAVRTHGRTFLFCDAKHGPGWACEAFARCGLGAVEVAVGERLSYPDERITSGTANELRGQKFDALSMARILNPAPVSGLPPIGIPDEAFQRGKVPMTKREIRRLVIAALQLTPDCAVWDVGAGTGSVSVECALQCPAGWVYAVEREADARALTEANARLFCAENLTVIPGSAPEAFAGLPTPARVFLGGTGGGMDAILDHIEGLGVNLRLVATAVTLESAHRLTERLSRWGDFEAAQIAVSRLETVGGSRMFRAQNPVFILSANWEGKQ